MDAIEDACILCRRQARNARDILVGLSDGGVTLFAAVVVDQHKGGNHGKQNHQHEPDTRTTAGNTIHGNLLITRLTAVEL